jgi:hypothetical protein
MTDHPMTGAQFRRYAGIDPERWAEQFLAAFANSDGVKTQADRLAFVTAFFRDAMQAGAATAEAGWMEVAKRRDQDEADG